MATDNVQANPGAGGATFRSLSDGTVQHSAEVLEYLTGGSAGAWTFQVVDPQHGLPVQGTNGSYTDAATTIVAGGASQILLAAASRRKLMIWNPVTESEPIYINFGAAAAIDNTSIPIEPGSFYVEDSPGFLSSQSINVTAFTTGHAVGCKWA